MTEEKKDEIKIELADEVVETKDEEMTADELKELGFNEKEIESAKEQKLTKKVEVKKDELKKVQGEEKKAEVLKEKKDDIKKSVDDDLSPEDEHKKLNSYNDNERALYWETKKNRRKRQEAETARDYALVQLKAKDQLIAELKSGKVKSEPEPEEKDPLDELDDDAMLTKKDYVALQKSRDDKERKKQEKIEAEQRQQQQVVSARLQEYEIKGKQDYKDFDKVVSLANDLIANNEKIFSVTQNENESDEEYESRSLTISKKKAKVTKMIRDWFIAVDRGDDSFGYTPADLAYEIGTMHPDYGKKKEDESKGKEQKMDDAKTEKVIENASRRMSSASVGGGSGKRVVSADELSLRQIAELSEAEFAKLPKVVRDKALYGDLK